MSFFIPNRQVNSSVSSILQILIPLILSALSENLLFLVDRIVLAYYSVDAMNSAMLGGNLAGVYTFMLMSIAGTTEIFVGQYNGAKEYHKIAPPVWQMIYFVAFSMAAAFVLGYFTEYINLIPRCYAEDGIAYQKILTYFCWIPALTAAFTGFFVGRGNTKIITGIVVIGTSVNILLDYLMVFGYANVIPAMGCRGAAIATVISEVIQVVILAGVFWRRGNRQAYGTGKNNKFDAKLFSKCLHVGMPMAIGRSAELLAWYLVYVALSHVSKELATIQGITVTIYVLFAFISDGLVKGTAAISANFIGQSNLAAIQKTFRKLIVITLILAFVTMLPLLVAPKLFFLLLNTLKDDLSGLHPTMTIIFRLLFANITLEALCCVIWGILLSGGDTKYQIIVHMTCLWGTVVLPVLILFVTGQLTSVITVQSLSILCNIFTLTLMYRRYRSLRWYKSLTH